MTAIVDTRPLSAGAEPFDFDAAQSELRCAELAYAVASHAVALVASPSLERFLR